MAKCYKLNLLLRGLNKAFLEAIKNSPAILYNLLNNNKQWCFKL